MGVVVVVPWWVSLIDFWGRWVSLVKRLAVKTWSEDEGLRVGGESETGL
jgi:hypothetical protein